MKQDQFQRYSRQILIEEIGPQGQRKINASKVIIIGAGGLGSPVIQYLAAAGVGTLGLVDFDKVELHNLNRQVIHKETTIGMAKVKSAALYVQKLNSHIHTICIEEKITPQNAISLLQEYDIIVDCSDNFATRYLINDTCVALGKPLVYGSILGFKGQLAVFNHNGSKNLRDIFAEPPSDEDLPDCDALGVLGPLPGIIGSMMVQQALQIVVELSVATNQLLMIDTLEWSFHKIEF